MIVLAVDTSSREGSISLAVDDRVLGPVGFGRDDSHLVAIGRSVEILLSEAGKKIEDLGRIALVSGPGSFTGLRIGMAFAKGIHAALGTELVILSSLKLLALAGRAGQRRVCPMIDARKNEIYTAVYELAESTEGENGCPEVQRRFQRLNSIVPMQVVSPADFLKQFGRAPLDGPIVFTGSGAICYREEISSALGSDAEFISGTDNQPSAVLLARLAEVMVPLSPDQVLNLEPLYLRSNDAKLKPLKDHRSHDRRKY
jgi:tRNA threonylcarbamoyladenosine biosynthesis protein TsaB